MASLHPELLSEEIVAELDQLEGVTLDSLLSLYFDEALLQIAEISSAIGTGDPRTVGETAHRLRGSSSTLGAAHVAHLAGELQASAEAGDLAIAPALLVTLRRGLQDTRQAFRRRAAATTTAHADPMTQIDSFRLSATPETTR
jgi:HPt (histidine-containing phosphotransfer) domain-containing protein